MNRLSVLAFGLVVAHAVPVGASNEYLERARRAHQAMRYDRVRPLLHQALTIATEDEKLEILELLAIMHVAYGETKQAREAFEELLKRQPDYSLPNDASPKVRNVFRSARKAVPKNVLTNIRIHATATHILAGQTADVYAGARNQRDLPHPVAVTWSASGGQMAPVSSSAVTDHHSRFTSDGTVGTFTIDVRAGDVHASTEVVVEAIDIPLRVNCGDNEPAVDGWIADDALVRGGSDWVGANAAVPNEPALVPVYASSRHPPHSYDIPVPDGHYVLRVHVAAGTSYLLAEGEPLPIADSPPVACDLDVEVAGGLQIEVGGDALIAGIELLPGKDAFTSTPPPPTEDHSDQAFYQTWWFWTAVAGAVVVGAGSAAVLGIYTRPAPPHDFGPGQLP